VQTCPETAHTKTEWTMPVLRGSGGHLKDPASTSAEADAIEHRSRIR